MKTARKLKEKINQHHPVLGVLGTNHVWPGMLPLLKDAGLDYLIIDLEHGAHPEDVVAQLCSMGRLLDFAVMIRTISCEDSIVRRAMDLGPCGLMLPCVNSAHQLDRVRDAVWMPPRGRRRPGGTGNHWIDDYNYATWRDEVEEDLFILPQIESRAGLANANAIAAHELTTAIAIGLYDLSADMGCCYEPENPVLLAATKCVREAGRLAEKNMWILGHGPTLIEDGFTFICIGDPTILLKNAAQLIVSQIQQSPIANSAKPPAQTVPLA